MGRVSASWAGISGHKTADSEVGWKAATEEERAQVLRGPSDRGLRPDW